MVTSLYQINIRVLLNSLAQANGSPLSLDEIPDDLIVNWSRMGFDAVWLLSVWQTGNAARYVSRTHKEWRREFQETLPDLKDDDIQGSGFAITAYRVHESLGGNSALARLRRRLRDHGLKLILDFVPNHFALDHEWTVSHPHLFRQGTQSHVRDQPHNYFRNHMGTIFAHGRDPYFDGWPDTVQLDYSQPQTVAQMQQELTHISTMCDGVRCDMAMLVLPDVFQRTWNSPALPFWPDAIQKIKHQNPDFCFLAEVYWDREWDLQQLGFDYCYDKRLYDRVLHDTPRSIHLHLLAGLDFQSKLARFLENHDELRINKVLSWERHQAAAIITYLTPGLKLFHEGQFEGRKQKVSPHLVRRPEEPVNTEIQSFYDAIRSICQSDFLQNGKWLLLDSKPAWPDNNTNDRLICFRWKNEEGRHLIVAVNHSDQPAQGRLKLSIDRTCVSQVILRDWIRNEHIEKHRGEIFNPGLLLEFAPWQYYVLEEVDS